MSLKSLLSTRMSFWLGLAAGHINQDLVRPERFSTSRPDMAAVS